MRSRTINPGTMIASIALVFALAGSAVALPGKGSVDKNDLQKNVVKSKHVKDGQLKTADLADGAVTGAKADESSFGKVPAATTADSATTATSAGDAATLGNQTAAQIRSTANGVFSNVVVDLLGADVSHQVLSTTVTVPPGGADLVANAGIELKNDAATASEARCQLMREGIPISTGVGENTPATNNARAAIGVSGFAEDVLEAGGNQTVTVQCRLTSGDMSYNEGDLNVTAIPDPG